MFLYCINIQEMCIRDRETGVRACVNVTVGKDISFAELRASSDAVVVATGTPKENALPIPLSLIHICFVYKKKKPVVFINEEIAHAVRVSVS